MFTKYIIKKQSKVITESWNSSDYGCPFTNRHFCNAIIQLNNPVEEPWIKMSLWRMNASRYCNLVAST